MFSIISCRHLFGHSDSNVAAKDRRSITIVTGITTVTGLSDDFLIVIDVSEFDLFFDHQIYNRHGVCRKAPIAFFADIIASSSAFFYCISFGFFF